MSLSRRTARSRGNDLLGLHLLKSWLSENAVWISRYLLIDWCLSWDLLSLLFSNNRLFLMIPCVCFNVRFLNDNWGLLLMIVIYYGNGWIARGEGLLLRPKPFTIESIWSVKTVKAVFNVNLVLSLITFGTVLIATFLLFVVAMKALFQLNVIVLLLAFRAFCVLRG